MKVVHGLNQWDCEASQSRFATGSHRRSIFHELPGFLVRSENFCLFHFVSFSFSVPEEAFQ
jgi:hypothetical protein